MASTYPQQLAEPSQWLAQEENLPGQQRLEAAQEQDEVGITPARAFVLKRHDEDYFENL